jgi:hypothetical protein
LYSLGTLDEEVTVVVVGFFVTVGDTFFFLDVAVGDDVLFPTLPPLLPPLPLPEDTFPDTLPGAAAVLFFLEPLVPLLGIGTLCEPVEGTSGAEVAESTTIPSDDNFAPEAICSGCFFKC